VVLNATFSNISVISWQSVLLVEEYCFKTCNGFNQDLGGTIYMYIDNRLGTVALNDEKVLLKSYRSTAK